MPLTALIHAFDDPGGIASSVHHKVVQTIGFGHIRCNTGATSLKAAWARFCLFCYVVGFIGFNGAGNGIRTRDFDLGKVALYH
jgi:hypothetical protein